MKLILMAVFTGFYCSLLAKVPDIVKTEGIKTSLQKNNIGRIFFTDKRVPTSLLKEEDFVTSYTLTNKSNLFFIAFIFAFWRCEVLGELYVVLLRFFLF